MTLYVPSHFRIDDIDALQRASRRTFTHDERDEIRTHQRRAYR